MEHLKKDCPDGWLSLAPPPGPIISLKRPISAIQEETKVHANFSDETDENLELVATKRRVAKEKEPLSDPINLDYLTLSMLAANNVGDTPPSWYGYIAIVGVAMREGDAFVEVHSDFCKQFETEIGTEWTLRDPKGFKHFVKFEMVEGKGQLTKGWSSVAEFYGLTGLNWAFLCLFGKSLFELIIFDNQYKQITYQKAPIDLGLKKHFGNSLVKYLDDNYVCWFSQTLTNTKACMFFLEIPEFAIKFMKGSGLGTWRVIGPTGKTEAVCLLNEDDPSKACFGLGWTRFCQRHALKRGHSLTIAFLSHKSRDIFVFMERCVVDQIPVELIPIGHL